MTKVKDLLRESQEGAFRAMSSNTDIQKMFNMGIN